METHLRKMLYPQIPLPSGTAFIADTFSINGILQSGANPVNGVNIGTITAGTTVTISFQVTVTSLPTENPIVNFHQHRTN